MLPKSRDALLPSAKVIAVHQVPTFSSARPVEATEIFTPTMPRAGRRALVGRQREMRRILDALTKESAHVVIYAERGRGKTSLTNLVVERLRRSGVIVSRYVCDATSSFDQIISGLLRDLPSSMLPPDNEGRAAGSIGCDSILPTSGLRPSDIATILQRLACPRLVFAIDEFDRVEDRPTRTRLADTIKLLSDKGIKLFFMIVGVSSTLDDIIGQHHSIQRNITGVHLPLLDDRDVELLLKDGAADAGMAFSSEACGTVVSVARGMPYLAQLMGLRILQETLFRGGEETSREDIVQALENLTADATQETATRYTALVTSPRGESMRLTLERLAIARQDRWGRIMPADLEPDLLAQLVDERVMQACAGLPGWYQIIDRPLINQVLLLRAQNHLTAPVEHHEAVTAVG